MHSHEMKLLTIVLPVTIPEKSISTLYYYQNNQLVFAFLTGDKEAIVFQQEERLRLLFHQGKFSASY